jgi:hypothetical protein
MQTEATGSVTHWIAALKNCDRAAAQPLWDRYSDRLVRLAHARLAHAPWRGAACDEEAAVLSAFKDVCLKAENGRFDKLDDRLDLWKLLVTITKRKAAKQIESARRLKRGGGHIGNDLRLMSWGDGTSVPTSSKNLFIVGIDSKNLLHIRIFDPLGDLIENTDETELPGSRAGAIEALKQQLPSLLPPHVLTNDEKARVISDVTSIIGQIRQIDCGAEILDQLPGSGPTPLLAAQSAEEYKRLLDLLGDEELRSVALWRLEGYTIEEIATKLDCSRRLVSMKVELIKRKWSREL